MLVEQLWFGRRRDMELERQLKLINKTTLKTIQTEYGDVIDCIDIQKQLAFDHPLLKNHKIQVQNYILIFFFTTFIAFSLNTIQATWLRDYTVITAAVCLHIGLLTSFWNNIYIYIYIYIYADGYHKTGCWNILCPSFVKIDKEVTLGEVLTNTSAYNGIQFEMMVLIYQDQVTGNWWFVFTEENIHVGYWPKSIFTHLAKGASQVSWGGRTSSRPEAPSAQMGSGYFPNDNFRHACFFRQIQYINGSHALQGPELYETIEYIDKPDCYNLKYYGDRGNDMGCAFLFGGRGGNCGT
ncbi:hypothetical protein HHK36_028587 [Tetracentron sinense]|uniref:Neprosin PEP catalytic domain-containing protein n=1 Tax=Tetracentron sinense TaxID=13715 RepID=A0A834YCQ7_TETSI|nr:hypothetical protein HHK36_028587 [Tetracentron sinense]